MKALQQCAKIVQSLQYNIRLLLALGLVCIYSKVCSSNKNPENKLQLLYYYNLYFFFNSRNKKINDKFLTFTKLNLTILDKYWHSVNFFYCKTYTRGVFRTQSSVYNNGFYNFLKEAPRCTNSLCNPATLCNP